MHKMGKKAAIHGFSKRIKISFPVKYLYYGNQNESS